MEEVITNKKELQEIIDKLLLAMDAKNRNI